MERATLRQQGRTSVLDLIDDGAALAKALKKIAARPAHERDGELAKIIDPVVEICEAGSKCADTGLGLIDIWRYFRHTWAHEYRSVPGRQMLVLIRNAAGPNRPVMGIAMLASPVMRLGTRDRWIGWLRDSAEDKLKSGEWEPLAFAKALRKRISESIKAIRWDDLASKEEIAHPTEKVVFRLEQKAAGAAFAREQQLKDHYEDHHDERGRVKPYRGDLKFARPDSDWTAASEDTSKPISAPRLRMMQHDRIFICYQYVMASFGVFSDTPGQAKITPTRWCPAASR
jgi:hypothetical protein